MALGITGRAARMVVEFTRARIAELGGGHMPAITWIVGDTDRQAPIPRLAVGIAQKSQVEGRLLECDELDCEVGQVLPDDVLEKYASHQIDLGDEGLVFRPKG
jgi:hypothetical protein